MNFEFKIIKKFVDKTKTDNAVALKYLSNHDWNIEAAVQSLIKDNKIKSTFFSDQF